MELTYEELNDYLLKISTARTYVNINIGSKLTTLILKQPDNDHKLRASIIYKQSYDKAIEEGLLPMDKLEEQLKNRNIFTNEDQAAIDKLESKLEGQRVLLAKTTKVKAHSDRLKKIIDELQTQINTIRYKKYSKLTMSAETKAEEDRDIFFCSQCTYKLDNTLYWPTYEAIWQERNMVFREAVIKKFLEFYNGINTTIVRYIARHTLWRIRYVTSQKVSEPLFGVATTSYTNDQLNLVYWSNYYQSIYEMMPEDRPSDLIIEDDESLDAYMTHYYEERNREDASRRSKKDSGGKLSAFDKEEVIVTRSNELYEDIKYDKPREAQRVKGRSDIKKRTRRRS